MTVTIRPLTETDALTSYKWRNDPEVFKYTGRTYDREIDIECETKWLREVLNHPSEYRCAILADDVYVGNIYLTNITTSSATFHIFIGEKNYWGKGVAKRASMEMLNHAFFMLGLSSVELYVKEENVPAMKLYERLGFVKKSVEGEWIRMILLNENYSHGDQ